MNKKETNEIGPKAKRVEFFINGKRFCVGKYTDWDYLRDLHHALFKKNGYSKMYDCPLEGRNMPGDLTDAEWWMNPDTYKVIMYDHRVFSGYIDSEGNLLYDGDIVNTGMGFNSHLHGTPFDETTYYVRQDRGWMSWTDYDIKDQNASKKLTKISDIKFGEDKSKWNIWKITEFNPEIEL